MLVDTKDLVHARDASGCKTDGGAREWVRALWDTCAGRLNAQVLHQPCVTLTRKLVPCLPVHDACRDVRDLSQRPLPPYASLIDEAWSAQDGHQLSFWDALTVAAAKRTARDHLLSKVPQHGQDLGGLMVVHPVAGMASCYRPLDRSPLEHLFAADFEASARSRLACTV